MLTSFADDEALFASIMAGAAGDVLKQIRGADLLRAIRTVGDGQSLLDPAVTKGVFDRLRNGKHLAQDEKLALCLARPSSDARGGTRSAAVVGGWRARLVTSSTICHQVRTSGSARSRATGSSPSSRAYARC